MSSQYEKRTSEIFAPRELKEYLEEIKNLKSSMSEKEGSLQRSQERNSLLISKLESAQDQLEKSHDQIDFQTQQIKYYKEQVQFLEEKLSKLQSADNKDYYIQELLETIQSKQRTIDTLSQNQTITYEKLEELKSEIEAKTDEIQSLQTRLAQTEESIDQLFLGEKTKNEVMLELQHLRNDNKRLLDLLAKTQEFKHLTEFFQDSEGTHYLACKKPSEESDNWVPRKAFKLIENTKSLNGEALETLVADLNKVFREREKNQIQRIKNQYETQVLNLKRQMFMRQPYDTVNGKKKVNRLQNELKKTQEQLRNANKPSKTPPGLEGFQQTLKKLDQLQRENTNLKKENQKLRTASKNKAGFVEGVGWLGEQVLKRGTQMHTLLQGLLTQDLESSSQEDLLSQLEKIVQEFSDSVEDLVDSSYKDSN